MIEQNMLRWFGHVETMSESRKADVSGNAGRGALVGHIIH